MYGPFQDLERRMKTSYTNLSNKKTIFFGRLFQCWCCFVDDKSVPFVGVGNRVRAFSKNLVLFFMARDTGPEISLAT